MDMSRLLLTIFAMLALGGCSASVAAPGDTLAPAIASDEEAERTAIYDQIKAAIAANDFSDLNAMEKGYRVSRARTSSGMWKLALYHAGLQFYLAEGLEKNKGCQYRKQDFVRRWTLATPESPAPVITEAALLLNQAWCIRGNGYADTVSADAWPRFRELIEAAEQVMARYRATAAIDPEYQAVRIDLLKNEGLSRSAFHEAIEEATAQEPGYDRIYYNAAWYYLPQWGGSYADLDAFARYAAERSHASEGGALYARIFWYLDDCGCEITEKASDWPMLERSMRDIYSHYPTRWNGDYIADLVCQKGDGEEGRRYLRALHPETTADEYFIGIFATCDLKKERRAELSR